MADFADIDDDRLANDEPASALIGVRVRSNANANLANRSASATVMLGGTRVSTHPAHWWGVPLLVPVQPGCDQMKADVLLQSYGAGVEVRLACDGALGASSTVDGGTLEVMTLTVPIGSATSTQRWRRAELQIRSIVGDLVDNGLTAVHSGSYLGGRAETVSVDTSSGAHGAHGWQTDHLLLRGLPFGQEAYAGLSWSDGTSTQLVLWGADPIDPIEPPDCSLYEVGSVALWSVCVTQRGQTLVLPSRESVAAGSTVTAAPLRRIVELTELAYETRGQCTVARPEVDWLGRQWGDGAFPAGDVRVSIGLSTVRMRDDDVIWRFGAWVVAGEASRSGADTECEMVPYAAADLPDPSGLGGASASAPVEPTARNSGSSVGVLPLFGRGLYAALSARWGGADLIYSGPGPSDLARLGIVDGDVRLERMFSGGYSPNVGASYRVEVERVWLYGAVWTSCGSIVEVMATDETGV